MNNAKALTLGLQHLLAMYTGAVFEAVPRKVAAGAKEASRTYFGEDFYLRLIK